MIATMVNDMTQERSILIVVLEKDNLDRMAKGDPATLESVNDGGILQVPLYPEKFSTLIAYETDDVELYKRARRASYDPMSFLQWLERGRKFIQGLDGKENSFKL